MSGDLIRIALVEDGEQRAQYRFSATPVRIGRSEDNDVVLSDSSVSAAHGEIQLAAEGIVYRDLRSTNGTRLRRGGRLVVAQITRAVLEDGDELLLGDPSISRSLRVQLAARRETKDDATVQIKASLDVRSADVREQLPAGFSRDALLALHKYASQVSTAPDEGALLDLFAESVFALFAKANHLAVYAAPEGSADYQPVLSRDRTGRTDHWPASQAIRDRVLEGAEALIFRDSDAEFAESQSLHSLRVRSGMCAPLLGPERAFGLVQLDARGDVRGAFSGPDLEVLVTFTHQLALGMRNLRLNRKLRTTIVELEEAHHRMEHLAFHDSLTGLSNRRLFEDRLRQALRSLSRGGRRLALLYLDLDGFKQVNDRYGHEAGDELLKSVGKRLTSCVREQDTVARLGGDEFTVLLLDVSSARGVSKVAAKILQAHEHPVRVGAHEVAITMSIGVTLAPDDGLDAETLINNADTALYRAKDLGRNNYQFFTDEMDLQARQHFQLDKELRYALVRRELTQLFAPLLRTEDLKLVAVEALLRWRHPERGLLVPEAFMEIAEEGGLLGALSEFVLRDAWRAGEAAGQAAHGEVKVIGNIPARQLTRPDFRPMVEELLAQTSLPPTRIGIGISESALFEDTGLSIENLLWLNALGVSLSIDGFGTGRASLTFLTRFPVDTVKLDAYLIERIPEDRTSEQIAAAAIAMAHKLGIRVAAKGVTTRAQLDFLKESGCDYVQGPLFSPPLSLEELVARVGGGAKSPRRTTTDADA